MIATGRAEVLADPACGAYWDYAPMIPIMEEAGGGFTSLRGEPVEAWSTALATNGRLHAAASAFWKFVDADRDLQTAALHARRDG
jgi:histidinol-phosphatase